MSTPTPWTDDELGEVGDDTRTTLVQLTAKEYEQHARELRRLRHERDVKIVGLLRDTRTLVAADAGEERTQLRLAQAATDQRIASLEHLLRQSEIVHLPPDDDVVHIGSFVKLHVPRTDSCRWYELVGLPGGQDDPHPAITLRSPVGQAIHGRAVGDVVCAELPNETTERLVILEVRTEQPPDAEHRCIEPPVRSVQA
jgi:transcription elongation GreA/GreB family factor